MKIVLLKNGDGRYLSLEPGEPAAIVANGAVPEAFLCNEEEDGVITLQALGARAQYVTASSKNGSHLYAGEDNPSTASRFVLKHFDTGAVSLQCSQNKQYVAVSEEGAVTASLKDTAASARFRLVECKMPYREADGRKKEEETDATFWEEKLHFALVLGTTGGLQESAPNHPLVKPFMNNFMFSVEFYTGITTGLKDADDHVYYTGPLWSFHFYDPDNGQNYQYIGATAYTQGEKYFYISSSLAQAILHKRLRNRPLLDKEMYWCGYHMGIACHYLTDLTQPMHAANFVNIFGEYFNTGNFNSNDNVHGNLEQMCDNLVRDYIRELPRFNEADMDISAFKTPGDLLGSVARYSKNYYMSDIRKMARDKQQNSSLFSPWTREEAIAIMDATVKPSGFRATARFILMWMREVLRGPVIKWGTWYKLRVVDRRGCLAHNDNWIRHSETPENDLHVFVKNDNGTYTVINNTRMGRRWTLKPQGWEMNVALELPNPNEPITQQFLPVSIGPGRVTFYEFTAGEALRVGRDGRLVRYVDDYGQLQIFELDEVGPVSPSEAKQMGI